MDDFREFSRKVNNTYPAFAACTKKPDFDKRGKYFAQSGHNLQCYAVSARVKIFVALTRMLVKSTVLFYNFIQMNWLKLLQDLADETDKIALRYFGQVDLQVEYKKDNSPVTAADKAIEEYIRAAAKKREPALGFYGEEFGQEEAELCLFIDPLDGTRSFVRGIPFFATLLGLAENGKLLTGLVSAPALGLRWQTARGQGAFLHNRNTGREKQLRVSQVSDLAKAQAFHGSLAGAEVNANSAAKILNIIRKTERQRGYGDFYQHMLVAQGSGEMAFDPELKAWDLAGPKIIVEEAGGKVTSFSGEENNLLSGTAVSTNGLLHETVLKLLN
jgi:histidinol-phosphatase